MGDGTAGHDGSLTGNIVDNAVLACNLNGNHSYSGVISGSGSLTKAGPGTLTLIGVNTYSGGTTINAGKTSLANSAALAGGGNITFAGGTLQFTPSNVADCSASIANSTGAISIDTNGQSVTFAGGLASSNTGGLAKIGPGTLIVANGTAYSGPTVIQGGTLKLQAPSLVGTATFTSDAASGISALNAYTEALAFAQGGTLNINGVTFANANNSGGGREPRQQLDDQRRPFGQTANFPPGFQPASGQGTYSLLNYLYYGGNSALTITGLVPGQSYNARIYHRDWWYGAGGYDNRLADFTFNNGVNTQYATVNEDVDANGHYIDYRYAAGPGGTMTISEANDVNMLGGGAWLWYGFTNQLVANGNLLPAATPLSIAGSSILDLNGVSQQVASLSDRTPGSGGSIVNSGTASAVLTLSATGGATTFSGTIAGGWHPWHDQPGDEREWQASARGQQHLHRLDNNQQRQAHRRWLAHELVVSVNGGTLGGTGYLSSATVAQAELWPQAIRRASCT